MSSQTGERSYRIGEVAERVGITTRTIRYYEELGLLGAAATNGRSPPTTANAPESSRPPFRSSSVSSTSFVHDSGNWPTSPTN
jgi:hypothetical protein